MNYIRKMCILRQVKQGFSGDGKALSGLIKVEQYGKNLAVEVSVINFAPLVSGEYYCLLSDGKGKTEMLSLRGKSLFNILSDLDVSAGFCGVICYVKNDIVPIAYGINGNGAYDWRSILNATLPPVFPRAEQENAFARSPDPFPDSTPAPSPTPTPMPTPTAPVEEPVPDPLPTTCPPPPTVPSPNIPQPIEYPIEPPAPQPTQPCPPPPTVPSTPTKYNDETVATENYYDHPTTNRSKENGYESIEFSKAGENAHAQGAAQDPHTQERPDSAANGNADGVLHAFKTDSDGYYASVKYEIDKLFGKYPRDTTLDKAFSRSEWARVKGSAKDPQYLVGVIYEDGKAKYICYALAATDKDDPPDEIKNVCTYVPASVFDDDRGFFVIFQSAATGECIKPERV